MIFNLYLDCLMAILFHSTHRRCHCSCRMNYDFVVRIVIFVVIALWWFYIILANWVIFGEFSCYCYCFKFHYAFHFLLLNWNCWRIFVGWFVIVVVIVIVFIVFVVATFFWSLSLRLYIRLFFVGICSIFII